MKYVICCLSLALCHHALAEKDPADLVRLRSGWEKAREKALKAVDDKYYQALKKLQKKYMQGGNLDAAVVVDGEINKSFPLKKPQSQLGNSKFSLISAQYGSGGKKVDVLERLQKSIRNGKINIVVNKKNFGDPVPHYKKHLSVKYLYQGEIMSKNFNEGVKIRLP